MPKLTIRIPAPTFSLVFPSSYSISCFIFIFVHNTTLVIVSFLYRTCSSLIKCLVSSPVSVNPCSHIRFEYCPRIVSYITPIFRFVLIFVHVLFLSIFRRNPLCFLSSIFSNTLLAYPFLSLSLSRPCRLPFLFLSQALPFFKSLPLSLSHQCSMSRTVLVSFPIS